MTPIKLDEGTIASGKIFPEEVEKLNPEGVGYHGTTSHAAKAIESSGFQPLSKTIGESRHALLIRLSRHLLPECAKGVEDQFAVMTKVSFFPISVLALKHTEQLGGQGIYTCLKPLAQKLLAHPGLQKDSDDWSAVNLLHTEIETIQKSHPVVYAVDLRKHEKVITWNLNGVYQVTGTVEPDRIIARLDAPGFSKYQEIDRELLEQRAKKLIEIRGHLAHRLYWREC